MKKVQEIAVIPTIGGDAPGLSSEVPPQVFDEPSQTSTEENSLLTVRGPVERDGKRVFIITKISFPS